MTFHGQEDFEIVKEVGILLCLSVFSIFVVFFFLQILKIHTVTETDIGFTWVWTQDFWQHNGWAKWLTYKNAIYLKLNTTQ